MGVLTNRATDIVLTVPEFCEAMGYLATPGRMLRIEAQVPYGKDAIFQHEYPGQSYYPMLPTSDKQSFQFRILLDSMWNCPPFLITEITKGGGNTAMGCIARGAFIERLVGNFGFEFSVSQQNIARIRACVQAHYPNNMADFDRGYNTPL